MVPCRASSRGRNPQQPSNQHQVLPAGKYVVHSGELSGEADRSADFRCLVDDVESGHRGRAGIRPQQGGKDSDQRRFSGPVGAEQGEDASGSHLKLDPAQNLHLFEGFPQVLNANGARRWLDAHEPSLPPGPPLSCSA